MSKKNIENYLPTVMDILNKKFNDKKVPKEFNGYISSFGATVIQSGLKPTIALFENQNAKTAHDKSCLTKIILEVLGTKEETLLSYVLKHNHDETALKQKILDISIAIKLSLRTFTLEKGLENVKC